jgi:signal transduction histidine kinase
MRERLYLVQGELTIDSKPATGTRINVRVPLTHAVTLPKSARNNLHDDPARLE